MFSEPYSQPFLAELAKAKKSGWGDELVGARGLNAMGCDPYHIAHSRSLAACSRARQLPQKVNHHEDNHSGACVVAFRVDGLCLDLGTCLRTPPGNLGAGGSFTSAPHLVRATAAPLVGARTGHHPRIATGNVEAERQALGLELLVSDAATLELEVDRQAGLLRQPALAGHEYRPGRVGQS